MKLLGNYSNEAIRVEVSRYEEYIAYYDCEVCNGNGHIKKDERGTYRVYSKINIQCPECELRFGTKSALRDRANEIQKEVKKILDKAKKSNGIKINARGRLPDKEFVFVERFNVYHPLAKEYRKCLYRLWTYEEPEYYLIEI